MCLNDETIEVPQSEVEAMLGQGAVCGGCDERCCPDTPTVNNKIDMCLNDNTINVNRNACEGILTAGGTCGACPEPIVEEEPVVEEEEVLPEEG